MLDVNSIPPPAQPPANRPDDDSVAGEEDPGASLEVLTPHPPASSTDPAKPQDDDAR